MSRLWIVCMLPVVLLLGCGSAEPEQPVPKAPPAGFGGDSWPVFRGDAALSGVAAGRLPDALESIWRFETGGEIAPAPVIDGGVVYAGSESGDVYALSLADGTVRWKVSLGDVVEAAPLVHGGRVFVGTLDGALHALDAAAGEHLWSFQAEAKITGSANWAADKAGDSLVFGSYDHNVYCLSASDGSERWRYETGSFVNGTPAISGGLVVAGGCDERLHILDVASGKALRTAWLSAPVAASPALREGAAFAGHYGDGLASVDLADGTILWEFQEKENGGAFFSCPAVDGESVVAGSRNGRIYCFDKATGNKRWAFATRDDVDASPVICGGRILCGSGDGRLYLLDGADGRLIWSADLGAAVTGSPAVVRNRVVVGAADGSLSCFGPAAPEGAAALGTERTSG